MVSDRWIRRAKGLVKTAVRTCGYEVRRFRPDESEAAQLVQALKIADINLVFDIGANTGQFARDIRQAGYHERIVSFEPLRSARAKLLIAAKQDSAWNVHDQAALGDSAGEALIHVAANSVSSSVLPMLESHVSAAPESVYVGIERVPIQRLDDIASYYLSPASSNLFIKIDAQGFEWQILDGAPDALRHARGLLCELSLVPLYEGQRLWREMVDRLHDEGFGLWAVQRGFTDSATGQSLQMDGIFLRHDAL